MKTNRLKDLVEKYVAELRDRGYIILDGEFSYTWMCVTKFGILYFTVQDSDESSVYMRFKDTMFVNKYLGITNHNCQATLFVGDYNAWSGKWNIHMFGNENFDYQFAFDEFKNRINGIITQY